MFSVDNFYSYLKNYYPIATLFTMTPWFSKDLWNYSPWGVDKKNYELDRFQDARALTSPSMIIHDQEPFLRKQALENYRNHLARNNPSYVVHDPPDDEIMLYPFETCNWPIFCHSQKNSSDIDWLEGLGFFPCHYFYHGLIGRDWFRHWKHDPSINKKSTQSLQHRFVLYARDFTGTRKYRKDLISNLTHQKTHIKHQWNSTVDVNSDYSAKIDIEDSVTCAINLVAETVFDEDMVHLTEKSLKPMVMKQPFILIGGPGSLRYLKDYGFLTFDEFWDESYDLEPDPRKRMDMITDLIENLCSLPKDRFLDLIDRCQSVVDHNHQWFFGEEFEKIMLTELHDNIQTGFDNQSRMSTKDPGGSFFKLREIRRKTQAISPKGLEQIRLLMDFLILNDTDRCQKILQKYPWAINQ